MESERDRSIDLTCAVAYLHQSVGSDSIDLQLLDSFSQSTLHEHRFHTLCLISLDAQRPTPSCFVEPIDEVEAFLQPSGVQKVWELGEEDSSVKGASIIVTPLKRVQPFVQAVVAEVVSAGQPLGDFQVAIAVPFSIAQVVVRVGTDWAVAFILRKISDVDIWAGHDEVQGR